MKTVFEFVGSLCDGGAETLVKDYALLLHKHGFNVKVIVLHYTTNTANYQVLHNNRIPIVSIYKRWNLVTRVFNKAFGKLYVGLKLRKLIVADRPISMHTHLSLLRYLKLISHSLKSVRLFYTCHSIPARYFSGRNKAEFWSAKTLIRKNGLRLIALHDEMREELNTMFNLDNTVVIRNGIDFTRYKNVNVSKENERTQLHIPQDAFVIGHVGRFEEEKNHDFLVDLVNACYRKNQKVFALFVGTGSLESKIRRKISDLGLSDRVLIMSHRSDIPQLMKAMDVFVFPSKLEGLGIVLIEAQVSGIRCVISDTIPKEVIKLDSVVALNLVNNTQEEWVEAILDDKLRGDAHQGIDAYDMNREIRRLEKLYTGDLNA